MLLVGAQLSASSILLSSERNVVCVLRDWWLCKGSQARESGSVGRLLQWDASDQN